MTHVAEKSLDKRTDKANVAACFIGLLLLANEKSLELRTPEVDASFGSQSKGVMQADVGYDLKNFRIFAPVS